MEKNNFSGSIDLAKLKNVAFVNIQGKTSTKACVCIPIEDNDIFITEKKQAYLNFTAWEANEVRYDQTHYLKQSYGEHFRKTLSEEELKNIPILGNMKPLKAGTRSITETASIEPTDDLPF